MALQLLRVAAPPLLRLPRPIQPVVLQPAPAVSVASPAVGVVARIRQGLFNPLRSGKALRSDLTLPSPAPVSGNLKRQIGFKASLAEFLLINRLRARIRPVKPAQSADVLQCGAKVIFVTCKAWFGDAEVRERDRGSRL
ncbi:MAG: hypothetical protein LH479_04075 [Polaromonas sp.]|nr:hypothetical protein [Polaromonas sp.]